MGNLPFVAVLQHIRRLVNTEAAQRWTDGELLRRYAVHRDEGAFAALVERHGPMVLGVCRRVLRHDQDTEDAFQAAFLVLARQAGAIRSPEALGRWLYEVAYH